MLVFVTSEPALGHGLLFIDTPRDFPLFCLAITVSLLQCLLKFAFSARYVNHLQFKMFRIYSVGIVLAYVNKNVM